jgi:hypothetical protein
VTGSPVVRKAATTEGKGTCDSGRVGGMIANVRHHAHNPALIAENVEVVTDRITLPKVPPRQRLVDDYDRRALRLIAGFDPASAHQPEMQRSEEAGIGAADNSRMEPGLAPGLHARVTALHSRLNLHLEMETQFCFGLAVQFAPPERCHRAPEPFTKSRHVPSSIGVEQPLHDPGHALPTGALGFELLPAPRGQLIETGAAIVLGRIPLRAHEPAKFQPHQGRVKGSHIQLDRASGYLLNSAGNCVPVLPAKDGQSLQNHQVERSLQNARFILVGLSIWHSNRV